MSAARSPSVRGGTASRNSSTTPKAGAAKPGGSKTPSGKKKGKSADDDKKEDVPKVDTQAELLKKLYAEQREAERVKALQDDVEVFKKRIAELTQDRENNLSRIRELIIHYDSKLNERDALLTRAQQTIQELTDTVTKQRHDAARLAVARDNDLARRIADEQMETRVWRDKFEKLYNDEKNKRMENLERDKNRLEAELEKAVKAHALHATELEHKIHIEKTKIRYSMIRKIKETKNALLAKTKDQLHTTTKRVIMENEQMTTELQYQSKETERTMELNDKLRAENRALKRDVALAAQESQMLANRTFFLKKLIAKLTEKLKVAERNNPTVVAGGAGIKNFPKPGVDGSAGAGGAGSGADAGGLDAHEQRIHELETQVEQLQDELLHTKTSAQQSVETTRAATEKLLSLQDEGTAFVLACLDDLKREQLPAVQGAAAAKGGEDVKKQDDSPLDVFRLPSARDSTPAERKRILDALLAKLRLQVAAMPGVPSSSSRNAGAGAAGSAAALRNSAAAAAISAAAGGSATTHADDADLDPETAAALADPDLDHDAVAAAVAAEGDDDAGGGGGDLPRPNASLDTASPTLPPVRGAAGAAASRHVPTADDPGFAI